MFNTRTSPLSRFEKYIHRVGLSRSGGANVVTRIERGYDQRLARRQQRDSDEQLENAERRAIAHKEALERLTGGGRAFMNSEPESYRIHFDFGPVCPPDSGGSSSKVVTERVVSSGRRREQEIPAFSVFDRETLELVGGLSFNEMVGNYDVLSRIAPNQLRRRPATSLRTNRPAGRQERTMDDDWISNQQGRERRVSRAREGESGPSP